MYFSNIHTIEELDLEYRKLAFDLHPDRNGSTQEATIAFQSMQTEYNETRNTMINPPPPVNQIRRTRSNVPTVRKKKITRIHKKRIVKTGAAFAGAVAEGITEKILSNFLVNK